MANVSELFEYIQEGFVPVHIEDGTRTVFEVTDEVDRDKHGEHIQHQQRTDEETRECVIVSHDPIDEKTLRKADDLLVWLRKTADANPTHTELFLQLRYLMIQSMSQRDIHASEDLWDFEATPEKFKVGVDAGISANVDILKEAETFQVTVIQGTSSALVGVDETLIGLLWSVNLEVLSPDRVPTVNFSFMYSDGTEVTVQRPVQLEDTLIEETDIGSAVTFSGHFKPDVTVTKQETEEDV